jgi:Mrp family chromosome partitioning ATPase
VPKKSNRSPVQRFKDSEPLNQNMGKINAKKKAILLYNLSTVCPEFKTGEEIVSNEAYKEREYFMSTIDKNTASISKKDTDKAMLDQHLQESKSSSSIKHKFLVLSSQGGVGKTSVTVNLAMSLAKKGMKVGLMDVNFYHPDIHRLLGLAPEIGNDFNKPRIPIAYSDDLIVASIKSMMQNGDETGIWGNRLDISDIRWFIYSVNWGSLDYLFVDTPACPAEGLLTVIRANPYAKTIIVTAPNKVSRDRAQNMINFVRKEKLAIFGWIENMRGFLCQHCGRRLELFSTGSAGRHVFLGEIPFLGRLPFDPHMAECADAGEPFLEKYPKSEVAEGCNLIIEKMAEGNQKDLSADRLTYYDL